MEEKVKFRGIKPELRILGIDYHSFTLRRTRKAILIGIVFRGGLWLDGVMKTEVEVDCLDVTDKIADMIETSPHYDQLRVIMLNGVTFAGFNVVNVRRLFELTGLPVIALVRGEQNMKDIKAALKNLPDWEERGKAIQDGGELVKMSLNRTTINILISGIAKEDAEKIVKMSCTRSSMPEPLRVAHIVASGLTELKMIERKKV